MGSLVYVALTSLDGFIEDEQGRFDWAMPDAEVHGFVNDLEASTSTSLYGRRMYETMRVWEDVTEGEPEEVGYAEVWRGLDKVVYSTTLDAVTTSRTTLERSFEPDAVRALVAAADGNVSVSGPALAGHAFRAGLVDEVHLFVSPVVVGGGKPGLPTGVRLDLELVAERRFGNGVVHLHHRVR